MINPYIWSVVQGEFGDIVYDEVGKFFEETGIDLRGRETAVLWVIYNWILERLPTRNPIEIEEYISNLAEQSKRVIVREAIWTYVQIGRMWSEMTKRK